MKNISVASRRMSLDCATCALSGRKSGHVVYSQNVMARTKQDEDRRECRYDCTVAALLHDTVYDGDGQAAQECGESAHADVGNVGLSVAVANVLETEAAVIANKPASKTKEEFREGRMYVEVVLSCDVIGGKFAEMDFIETEASCT